MRSLRVGLTGGIACGKSEVLRHFEAAGLVTLDLDAVAHAVMAPGGSAYAEVVDAFGRGILAPDGAIDRSVLGATVFADPDARRRLDHLVHPKVREEEARRTAAWVKPGAVIVTDAALLVETGQHVRFDRLVVVHCRPEEQLRRLRGRDGMGEEAARARLRAQLPMDEKRLFAHDEVDTNGSLAQTHARADALARELRDRAARPQPPARLQPARALGCLQYGARRGPRGLDPLRLAREMRHSRTLGMEDFRGWLDPPAAPPWYRAARPEEGPPGPEALAGPLALGSLTRGVADEDFLLALASSMARLTHPTIDAIGSTGLSALVVQAAAAGGEGRGLQERLGEWRVRSERWTKGPFQSRVEAAVAAAARYAGDPARARADSLRAGGDPDLAGALAGLDAPSPEGGFDPEVIAAVESLTTGAGSSAD